MWDRVELKGRGKHAFLKNYWRCVLVAFILTLLLGNGYSSGNRNNHQETQDGNSISIHIGGNRIAYNMPFQVENDHAAPNIISGFFHTLGRFISGGFMLAFFLIGLCINFLLVYPLEIGGCRFFVENAFDSPGPGRLLFAFQSGHYLDMVVAMFLKSLYQTLWTFLLIVPGIIKRYEYRMVPYLLADCPEMSRQDAFRISKEMMYGQKMDAFVLDLSFIGWHLLNACTCGLLGAFYVNPYQYATNAELFLALKREYLHR